MFILFPMSSSSCASAFVFHCFGVMCLSRMCHCLFPFCFVVGACALCRHNAEPFNYCLFAWFDDLITFVLIYWQDVLVCYSCFYWQDVLVCSVYLYVWFVRCILCKVHCTARFQVCYHLSITPLSLKVTKTTYWSNQ